MNEPPTEDRSEVQALASEVIELRLALNGFQDMLGHIWDLLDDTVERLEEYLSQRYPGLEYDPSEEPQYKLPFEDPVDYSQVPF
jgi:hypothetical protein